MTSGKKTPATAAPRNRPARSSATRGTSVSSTARAAKEPDPPPHSDPEPAKHLDGMGAIVTSAGACFRVWAPHASAVAVKGSFNDWSDTANPLAGEPNGYWYTFVPGVAAGAEYKYLITNGGQSLHRVDPYAFQVTNSVGNGVVYDHTAFDWQDDRFSCPPHNDLVIYELHVGSFAPDEGRVGTFDEVQDNIQHFRRLGVSAIQLMPAAEFAGDYSWGYNPAHIFAVESGYGGPDALKTLVREAHKAGVAVIMDVVYNHFGPSDLNLWQFDGWSEDGKGGIYFYNDWRSSTPWGDTRPDYGRGEVRSFIRDNAWMWLRDYHVDGLRFDMTPYMRSVDADGDLDLPDGWSLQSWLNRGIRQEFPDAITIAEDLHGDGAVTSTGPNGAAYHAQWDAKFVHPVREAIIVANDAYRSMPSVIDAIAYDYGDTYARVIYTESHDDVANGRSRVPQEVDPGDPQGYWSQKRSTLGAGLVFTSPGIPMIFQGQEFLQGGWFRDDVSIDWELDQEYRGIVRLYRDLIALRRNLAGLTRGMLGSGLRIIHANDELNMIAFQRWWDHGPRDDVVVIANLDSHARHDYRIGMPNDGLWKLRFNSDASTYSEVFGDFDSFDTTAWKGGFDGMAAHAEIDIAPYTLLIYSQD